MAGGARRRQGELPGRIRDSAVRVKSFPPVVGSAPKVLILGSMPGRASLAAGEYYAHSQNAFWRIMDAVGVTKAELPYARRLAGLIDARIALWDVLAACDRPGSLDSSIVAESEIPNDIGALVVAHPSLHDVLLNGTKAERAFRRHILPNLPPHAADRLRVVRVPSTSPARAIAFEAKLEAWRTALAVALARGALR